MLLTKYPFNQNSQKKNRQNFRFKYLKIKQLHPNECFILKKHDKKQQHFMPNYPYLWEEFLKNKKQF